MHTYASMGSMWALPLQDEAFYFVSMLNLTHK